MFPMLYIFWACLTFECLYIMSKMREFIDAYQYYSYLMPSAEVEIARNSCLVLVNIVKCTGGVQSLMMVGLVVNGGGFILLYI